VSLFRRLSDAHPQAVIDLTDQYRMNKDIMLLSNKLIYGDRLQCGSEMVANRTLNIPDRQFLQNIHKHTKSTCHGGECWIEQLMSER
jgi:DNA replication ATP-dependent helicase Dna2